MDWPFDQGPNVATITTAGVLEKGLPILVVQHFADDDSWGFFCGTTNKTEDLRVIAMEEALKRDPGLRAIADLPSGWIARRSSARANWVRSKV